MNPYKVLGVRKNATPETITRAFRKASMRHHPDRNPGDEGARARFAECKLAYDVLSDPERRARYDKTGQVEELPPDKSLAEALAVVSGAITYVVSSMLEQGFDPLSQPMMNAIRDTIRNGKKNFQDSKKKVVKARETLAKLRDRFNGGEGVMQEMIDSHLAAIARQVQNFDAQIASHDRALEIIAGVTYEQLAQTVDWPSVSTATGTVFVRYASASNR